MGSSEFLKKKKRKLCNMLRTLFQGFSQFQEKPNNDTKASDLLRHFEDFLYI
jgi:hypothetical protein